MSVQTPRQRGVVGRGTVNASSSPNLRLSFGPGVGAVNTRNRKSLSHSLAGHNPSTPRTSIMPDPEFTVGELVDVPGDMHGTVKFIGSVRGKQGKFVGVELSREFAARGKNDGDVDGISYFTTSVPGSGIFLPVHRAERHRSPAPSLDSFPRTPMTPSYGTHRGQPAAADDYTPPMPNIPNFSQSVGPGARPSSPQFKPRSSRPSLPRPESPLRKQPTLAPTPARNFSLSQSLRGGVPPRMTASPAPARTATPRAASTTRGPPPARPYSRSGSRLGNRPDSGSSASMTAAQSLAHARRSPSRLTNNNDQDDEIRRLVEQLHDKDRQLKEQAESLAEMDASLKEIQSLIPDDDPNDPYAKSDVTDLRQALRDKNEKIQSLVAEFDAHRADFRSTIDTLELASAETERVYEAKLGDLLAELQELREIGQGREEVEQVADQLRSLEELVAELEDGLEDARRGEAEARGEVEFLRGEVERGRSELRREREKAAKALQGAKEVEGLQTSQEDVETKDDEIRGLKAIIHSLSSGSGPDLGSPGSSRAGHKSMDAEELQRIRASMQQLEREKLELQGLVERKTFREEELERTVEQLKAGQGQRNGVVDGDDALLRPKGLSPKPRRASPFPVDRTTRTEEESHDDGERDVSDRLHGLQLSHTDNAHGSDDYADGHGRQTAHDTARKVEFDADKWCALCEKDGHLAFDCPEEL